MASLSPLLHLPLEIRRTIYDSALSETNFATRSEEQDIFVARQDRNIFLANGSVSIARLSSTPLVRTCQTIRHEIFNMFLPRLTLSLDFSRRCRNFSPYEGVGGTFHFPWVWKIANRSLWEFCDRVRSRIGDTRKAPLNKLVIYLLDDHGFELDRQHHLLFQTIVRRAMFKTIVIRTRARNVHLITFAFANTGIPNGELDWTSSMNHIVSETMEEPEPNHCLLPGESIALCESSIYRQLPRKFDPSPGIEQHGIATDSRIDSPYDTHEGDNMIVDITYSINNSHDWSNNQYKTTTRTLTPPEVRQMQTSHLTRSVVEVWTLPPEVDNNAHVEHNIWGVNMTSPTRSKTFRRTCYVQRRKWPLSMRS